MRPVVLLILDGWGVNDSVTGNAVAHAKTPNLKKLMKNYPFSVLEASGTALGLMKGQVGGSEIGHLHIGAGRVIYKEQAAINDAIKSRQFFANKVLLDAIKNVKKNKSAIHFVGCLSDSGVHSHIDHLFALLELASENGVKDVFVHPMLDGRDTLPKVAERYIESLEKKILELETGKIATVAGRYYGMDRDSQWHRIDAYYSALVHSEGLKASSAKEAVSQAYFRNESDEFIKPTIIMDKNGPIGSVKNNDTVIFFNYRADRARELTQAFVDGAFQNFDRKKNLDVHFVCMTEYEKGVKAPVAFPPPVVENTLGEVLSRAGMKQLRVAETEKYAHVTFFLNGGREQPHLGEDRRLIPSPREAGTNSAFTPSSELITDVAVEELKTGKFDVAIINFADPDVAGHSGRFEDCVRVAESIDACIGKLTDLMDKLKGALIITGDHGNIEQMIDPETGSPHTAHTTNPVPFILYSPYRGKVAGGSLIDVAPTILALLGIPKPKEMTGKNLILGEMPTA
jgi:2,3-bisphosphoglycerate-independent phosphoglycerate mutase